VTDRERRDKSFLPARTTGECTGVPVCWRRIFLKKTAGVGEEMKTPLNSFSKPWTETGGGEVWMKYEH